jgi:hypothetical protein
VPERIALDRVDVAAGMLPKGLHIAPRQSIRNTAHVRAGRFSRFAADPEPGLQASRGLGNKEIPYARRERVFPFSIYFVDRGWTGR